jgi:methylmalonyl-CoA mutase
MGREIMKNQSFPLQTDDDWKLKAEESLKGKSIQTLHTTTYENITLKPLYSQEDETHATQFPGGEDFRRGIHSLGYFENKWKIAQNISYQTPSELVERLEKAIQRGQTALSFELNDSLFDYEHVFLKIIKEYAVKYPLAIDGKEFLSKGLDSIAGLDPNEYPNILGFFATDPISSFAHDGEIPQNSEVFFSDWAKTIIAANQQFPNVRTVLINSSIYHNGGANAVQELAIAAATGVFYLQHLLENSESLNQALSKMIFQFSIGSNFFMEIAKLRAARILWSKISEAYGAEGEWRGMEIIAQTSSFTKTIYDPHVNLLRAGNEALAAVLGGIQYLQVDPYDQITGSTNFSERIAQNTQLILQEEANLQKVIDPAGGSWYIEKLTKELADHAWKLFKEIDQKGGMLDVLKSGWLQNEISIVYEKRQQDIFTRKASIIGTNVYANLDEQGPDCSHCEKEQNNSFQSEKIKIDQFPQLRLSQSFENLRERAEKINQKSGSRPLVTLLCLGSLKQYKARADFMKGFFAAGGINGVESSPIHSSETVKQTVRESNTKYFCLCGSNEQYAELGFEIIQLLKSEFPDRIVYLAGLPEKDEQSNWLSAGIHSFIHVKSNSYEMLSTILSDMEVPRNEHQQA